MIINNLGQEVFSKSISPEDGSIAWNGLDSHGRRCGEGVYFYTLTTSFFTATRKLMIIK